MFAAFLTLLLFVIKWDSNPSNHLLDQGCPVSWNRTRQFYRPSHPGDKVNANGGPSCACAAHLHGLHPSFSPLLSSGSLFFPPKFPWGYPSVGSPAPVLHSWARFLAFQHPSSACLVILIVSFPLDFPSNNVWFSLEADKGGRWKFISEGKLEEESEVLFQKPLSEVTGAFQESLKNAIREVMNLVVNSVQDQVIFSLFGFLINPQET